MTEIIYIAKPTRFTEETYCGYTRFFEKFAAQLAAYHEVRALELPDIWVRDFLPLQNVQTGQLYQHFFDPRYANYTPKFTDIIRRYVHQFFPHILPCQVRIDGGNILLSPDKKYALCLEKRTIFCKNDTTKKEFAESELKRALGVEKIVWLPQQTGDKIGHIDGYLQFLGNFLLEGTEQFYGGITTGPLLNEKATDILRRQVPFERIPLLCIPDEENYLSANGLYVNFLETSRAVFVPQFNLPEDEKALETLHAHTHKPLVLVNAKKIAQYGGTVHCLTREYNE